MGERMNRQQRLHKLLDLARAYRGWSRAELARALGRDPARVYPESDNPRIDFLVGLADALEWPLDAVVEYLWYGNEGATADDPVDGEFDRLDGLAREYEMSAEFHKALDVARRMLATARTPTQRARAFRREAVAWHGLGRLVKSLNAIESALRESPLPTDLRLALQGNLAVAHDALGDNSQALGLSHALIDWFASSPPRTLRESVTMAFAHYIHGNSHRQLIWADPESANQHAQRADLDLERARSRFDELGRLHARDDLLAVANTCRGALIQVSVALGRLQPEHAVAELLAGVPGSSHIAPGHGRSDWLESRGWWCVFGAELAVEHLCGQALQRRLAILTDKLLEIAGALENWAFRQRAVQFQYAMNERLGASAGAKLDLVIDDEDIRTLVGSMGRFPAFRRLGWRILCDAKVVRNEN